MTDYWNSGEPHCRCGAVKILRYKWKTEPIPHPSLFWGCIKFTSLDAHRHDKASPYRHSLYSDIYNKEDYLVDKELNAFGQRLIEAVGF